MEERNYLEEYNESLDLLLNYGQIDEKDKVKLKEKLERIANEVLTEEKTNQTYYETFENVKNHMKSIVKVSGVGFVSSLILMVGTHLAGKLGFSNELILESNKMVEQCSVILGSTTFGFGTVTFVLKSLSAAFKHNYYNLKAQRENIQDLPYNSLKQIINEDDNELIK